MIITPKLVVPTCDSQAAEGFQSGISRFQSGISRFQIGTGVRDWLSLKSRSIIRTPSIGPYYWLDNLVRASGPDLPGSPYDGVIQCDPSANYSVCAAFFDVCAMDKMAACVPIVCYC